MSRKPALNVVLLWHMHQPEYRDLKTGRFQLPWAYLHAIKDYTDMAWHLENVTGARAVVNFVPVLLDQLHSYHRQIQVWQEHGRALDDPFLHCLVSDQQIALRGMRQIISDCSRVNEERLLLRFPAFQRLARLAKDFISNPGTACYLNKRFFSDLVVWYHLAWLGESVRRENPLVQALIAKGNAFSMEDRRQLLQLIGDLIGAIVPRFRALAKAGKVELAMSPYAHPMLPLLDDFQLAAVSMPQIALPSQNYPGGAARCRWHIEQGIATFIKHFGFRPYGCWPSEGGVSQRALAQLGEFGFKWIGSGDKVLENSQNLADADSTTAQLSANCRHKAYILGESDTPLLFFRDDGLSDLIGFSYSTWHADDAIADLLKHLQRIREGCGNPAESVVSIVLDGENPWEYYPENAWWFLNGLYRQLSEDPGVNLTTYAGLPLAGLQPVTLPVLAPGSWVHGDFSAWIGDAAKNRAWEYLCDAKQVYDKLPPEQARQPKLLRQLAVCEGSDWFWWLGDSNPADGVTDFDLLYRKNLRNLYELMEASVPAYLNQPISLGSKTSSVESGGTMRRGESS